VDAFVSDSDQPGHDHGSLSEEAGRLAEAFAGWVNSSDAAATWRRSAGAIPEEGAEAAPPPECAVCPVCQLLRLVRGLRPEVFEQLSIASAALLAAARAALDGPGTGSAAAEPDSTAPAAPRPRPTSQRIDIR
jgi:hypothetical protein